MPRIIGSSRSRRAIAFLLLSALLAASAASAAPLRPAGGPALDLGGLLLGGLRTALTFLWAAEGCSIDPSGRCLPAPAAAESDNGCSIDPSGHCGSAPAAAESDAGCSIDPFGRCASGN